LVSDEKQIPRGPEVPLVMTIPGSLPPRRATTGYHPLETLRKYSYLTCTFVILTASRFAVGLGLGRWEYRCPHPSRRAGARVAIRSLTIWAALRAWPRAKSRGRSPQSLPWATPKGEIPSAARDH